MFNNFEGFFNLEDMFNQKKQMDKCVMFQMSLTTLVVVSSLCLKKETSWVIAAGFFGLGSAFFLNLASSLELDEEQPVDRKETESPTSVAEFPILPFSGNIYRNSNSYSICDSSPLG